MRSKIEEEIKKIRRKYQSSAEEIVRDYNREISLTRDYEGRQIFELLQNADDEAADSDGKVLISFDGSILSVSNTGKPFSFAGVKSLLYSNASPKQIHADKIGSKGLGFRSILSWADMITVASKDFTLQFSKKHAERAYSSIVAEEPELLDEIKRLTTDQYPIATLTCPKILDEDRLIPGFSTSIIINCKPAMSDTIRKQIQALEFEELIFLPNLKKIEIRCEDYQKAFCKLEENGEAIIEAKDLLTGGEDCAGWRLFKEKGSVTDENGRDKDYEFIIAYDPERKHTGEVLYSYFKTDIKMKFPALIHGTFELTSDRNRLQKGSAVNSSLIERLSDFIVQTAVEISEGSDECNYDPLRMVISVDLDHSLESIYHFGTLLKQKARGKRILPTLSGKYASIADSPFYSVNAFDKVLDPKHFERLMPRTRDSSIEDYIRNELGIRFLPYTDFCQALNESIEQYSLDQRAELIYLIDKEYGTTKSEKVFPHLLIDSNGNNIINDDRIYLIPEEEQLTVLPEWVRIRFLSEEMNKAIGSRLSITNRRDMSEKLSRYHLEEYSFERLLRGISSQTDSSYDQAGRCRDVINWLWNYYDSTENPLSIDDIRIKVICRDGSVRYAAESYLGSEFSNALGERLISTFSDAFISEICLDIPENSSKKVIAFFEWLGASRFPRVINKTLADEERNAYLKHCGGLFVQSDNHEYLYTDFQNKPTVTVGSLEQLDTLLSKADFNDLLAWFMIDENVKARLNTDTEEKNHKSCITGIPEAKRNPRTVRPEHMRSYLLWVLSNTAWIPDKDGNKCRPDHCCFFDEGLSPLVIVPETDYEKLKAIIGHSCRKEADALLNRLGAADAFDELNSGVIFEALFKLDTIDTECRRGKSLYRKIIKSNQPVAVYIKNNQWHERFIKEGTVLVRSGDEHKYVPVSKAYYADKKVFSSEILKSFNMLEVDRRSGEEKISRLFGVKPLKCSAIEISEAPRLHSLNNEFQVEYKHFIPFVYACRLETKTSKNDYRKLKSTKITLCSRLRITYNFNELSRDSYLGYYETVYLKDNNTAYIQTPDNINGFSELKTEFDFANALAELICDIIDVQEDRSFFRDLFMDSIPGREKRMRCDRNDDNLELLTEARRQLDADADPEDEFWRTLAEVMKISSKESFDTFGIISALGVSDQLASLIDYNDISSIKTIPYIIDLFAQLNIDISDFNNMAVRSVSAVEYWRKQLNEKKAQYKARYQAYLFEKLKEDKNNAEELERLMEEYDTAEFKIKNTIHTDIEKLFIEQFGIGFSALDEYDPTDMESLIAIELDSQDKEALKLYSDTKVNAYALFGRSKELLNKTGKSDEPVKPTAPDTDVKQCIDDILSDAPRGFSRMETKASKEAEAPSQSGNNRSVKGTAYSGASDSAKKKTGLIGEAAAYKELKALYPSTRWVSGNAEKAGAVEKGDDSCGYDMYYIDGEGNTQYVEVKASRNDGIDFQMSDSEFKFACDHAKEYEIIFVRIGDDDKPINKPMRLGHLFDLTEGETPFNNSKFTIGIKKYTITALCQEAAEERPGKIVVTV